MQPSHPGQTKWTNRKDSYKDVKISIHDEHKDRRDLIVWNLANIEKQCWTYNEARGEELLNTEE